MKRYRSFVMSVWFCLIDLGLTELALWIADHLRPYSPVGVRVAVNFSFTDPTKYIQIGVIWLVAFGIAQVYVPKNTLTLSTALRSMLVGIIYASFLLACSFFVLKVESFSRILFGGFIILDAFLLIALRLAAFRYTWLWVRRPEQRVAILGTGQLAVALAARLRQTLPTSAHIVGYIAENEGAVDMTTLDAPVIGHSLAAADIAADKSLSDVYIALEPASTARLGAIMVLLAQSQVAIKIVPTLVEALSHQAQYSDNDGIPLLHFNNSGISRYNWIIKRGFDMSVAALCLLFALPFMAVIAVLIRRDSPGPAIFKQQRVGYHGKLFTMYKFRTMFINAEAMTVQQLALAGQTEHPLQFVHKTNGDPRVTRFGRFLRRTSLDELPQLFNVLNGTMSIVGPRPELQHIVANYQSWQLERLIVPQGITGWWQVNGRSDKPMHLNTEFDIYYVRHYSIGLDARILWKTVTAVIGGHGAY